MFQSAKDNATLVSFHQTYEVGFVQRPITPGITGLVWTGLNDRITEGTYTWSDGTSVDHTSWKANEPTGLKEDCVGIEGTSYGTLMSDAPCTEPHSYVSRKPLEGEELPLYLPFQRLFERTPMDYISRHCTFDPESSS